MTTNKVCSTNRSKPLNEANLPRSVSNEVEWRSHLYASQQMSKTNLEMTCQIWLRASNNPDNVDNCARDLPMMSWDIWHLGGVSKLPVYLEKWAK